MSAVLEYFEALERLKSGASIHIPKGTKITKDAVALEAQRQKGSIKKGREVFAELINAIDEAALLQIKPKLEDKAKVAKANGKAEHYRTLYERSLTREVMLIERIDQLECELATYKMTNITKKNPFIGSKNGQNNTHLSI